MDKINPNHYKSETSLECIEAMQIAFGKKPVFHFCLCNAFKYIWRWKNKNGKEDLQKAEWYIKKAKELEPKVYDPINAYVILDEMTEYVYREIEIYDDIF